LVLSSSRGRQARWLSVSPISREVMQRGGEAVQKKYKNFKKEVDDRLHQTYSPPIDAGKSLAAKEKPTRR